MADFSRISRSTLADRRRQLRRHRRMRAIQGLWRTVVVMGLAGGAIWVIQSPIWIVQSADQVVIQGNELLSPERVRSLLGLEYPKPLWAVQPEAIAQNLEISGPIAQATVTRHLWPPNIVVDIEERRPVAAVQGYIADPAAPNASPASNGTGLLDATGAWIPMEDYALLSSSLQMPPLVVIGMRGSDRTQWVEIYNQLTYYQQNTPNAVHISELDWRSPSNLILKTELGSVHLGVYQSTKYLAQQLQALTQMRQLPKEMNGRQVDYIDLRRPEDPILQMR
ncbi:MULTISPECIES: FtsQ-type POTRA domain-containing protein [unclassified Leptolyngbya]|uniref:cell division protein FtsQ/DivIB n=1 Tax=unclassified Leptolyngbya TaxID=2650499 RepID=UPI0016843419|nr:MULTISPECIES: FtsQ-type POTRA domain-containing protein [unclassified Leptolyngbya]MBD1912922.1 FtsQ-type POTRA domain-containing protein [Leptolyngbya sp. FACHB-8]MBD2154749.1 FtsQ-type POTRA domain-containing protein [Leptolyngbya sp. FACHB-16]